MINRRSFNVGIAVASIVPIVPATVKAAGSTMVKSAGLDMSYSNRPLSAIPPIDADVLDIAQNALNTYLNGEFRELFFKKSNNEVHSEPLFMYPGLSFYRGPNAVDNDEPRSIYLTKERAEKDYDSISYTKISQSKFSVAARIFESELEDRNSILEKYLPQAFRALCNQMHQDVQGKFRLVIAYPGMSTVNDWIEQLSELNPSFELVSNWRPCPEHDTRTLNYSVRAAWGVG